MIEPNPDDRCLVSYVNDCHKDIRNPIKTEQDKQRQNTDFIDGTVDAISQLIQKN